MKYLAAFFFATSVACAYITPPDEVLIDGRVLLTSTRPLATFPWRGVHPRLSEYPEEGHSDSRELAALWEIRDDRLYLVAVHGYRFLPFSPTESVGLRDLMPERIQEGKVFADWFTGEFRVFERLSSEQIELLRSQNTRPKRVVRKFQVKNGKVAEEPNQVPEPTVASGRGPSSTLGAAMKLG